MYQTLRNNKYVLIIILISILFLFFYSANTSPLYPDFYGWDSAFFSLVGQMINDGKMIYVDIIDSKGPVLYWLYALGEQILQGGAGVWLIQAVFFCISMYYAFQIIKLFVYKEKHGLFILGIGTMVWMATFENGGLTEELSLPFLLSGSYYLVRYCQEGEQEDHIPGYAFWYGISFAVMVFIRITNAAMLCGLVAGVVIILMGQKRWKNLCLNAVCFLLGVMLVTLPVLLYFLKNNALKDMILGMFQLAGNYAGHGLTFISLQELFIWFCKNSLIIFSICTALLYAKKKNKNCGYAVMFAESVLLLTLALGNGYLHYFTLAVPAFLISLSMLWNMLGGWSRKNIYSWYQNSRVSSTILSVLLITTICYYGKYSIMTTGGNILKATTRYYLDTYENIRRQTELIPKEERDSVLAYNIRPRWYVIGELQPCYRLGAYQENFTRLVGQLAKEQEGNFRSNPPRWVAVEWDYLDCPQLEEMLHTDYEMKNESENISLYRRKN